MTTFFERHSILIALIVAWIALLGSLYFSEIAHFVPCPLCWYQRVFMYPLSLLLLIATLRQERQIAFYILPFSLLGAGFSTYHYLLQKTDLFSHGSACSVGIPCTTTWINWFGVVTIPFLALIGFLIISFMMLISLTVSDFDQEYADEIEVA
ncbi:MAG: disulfide bond formation protein B [Chloroflexi bacterium]|nr:disulfide bond formation protein B [Chloroflexota bacterium]